jgi:tripartite ATP-independent transporter DctM subunit
VEWMLIAFVAFMIIGVPIGYSILASTVVYFLLDGDIPLVIIIQKMISGPSSYTLLSVPLFILAGNLMNSGGITSRIYKFANVLVGHLPGGLGQVNIVASVIFSGMTGSANAEAAGLGLIELKAMREQGYDDDFAIGIIGASSLIGPIIPPSVPAIIVATVASVSVGSLFIAGIIPGLIMACCLGVSVYIIAKKRNYRTHSRPQFREIVKAFLEAFPSLLTPIIIIGGLWTGWFTATEAAAVAVLYATFLSMVVYKDLKIGDLGGVFYKSAYYCIPFMFIVAVSMVFGWIIIREQAGEQIGTLLLSISQNKWVILTILNLIMLFLGCFVDPFVTILLLVPIIEPILKTVNINMIHFGIVMILNLMIGLLTPPLGSVLNTLSTISGVSFEKVTKSVFMFMLPLIIALILITYIPELTLFLPNLIFNPSH